MLESLSLSRMCQLFERPEEALRLGLTIDTRRWSDMSAYFHGSPATGIDQVIYQICNWPSSPGMSDLLITVTLLYPGAINGEFFHTKGHFHDNPDGPELVVGYGGEGYLQLATREGTVTEVRVTEGEQVFVPPGYGHRAVNRSDSPIYYLSVSTADVGHDYDSVTRVGWRC